VRERGWTLRYEKASWNVELKAIKAKGVRNNKLLRRSDKKTSTVLVDIYDFIRESM
jgi:hypothetical protein